MKSPAVYGYAFVAASVLHLAVLWAGGAVYKAGVDNSQSGSAGSAASIRLDGISLEAAGPARLNSGAARREITLVQTLEPATQEQMFEEYNTPGKDVGESGQAFFAPSDFGLGYGDGTGDGLCDTGFIKPRPGRKIDPSYPIEARLRREQGAVDVRVFVSAMGGVEKISLARSCGFSALDKAALAAVGNTFFKPALLRGKPVAGQVLIRIKFELQD